MENIKLLKVFIGSPSDVVEERIMLEGVIDELNQIIADVYNLRLELVKWEKNTSPSILGNDAQDIINQQINDDYDIFIGIMWSRAGSKTSRADSGTIEEFKRAYDRAKLGEDVEIMFYFNDAPISISDIDVAQIQVIKDFRSSLGKEGVYYWSYKESKNFESLVRIHLMMKIKGWHSRHNSSSQQVETLKQEDDIFEEEEVEEGLLDLYTDLNQSSFYLVISMNGIQTLIHEFISEIVERTEEVTKFSDVQNLRLTKMAITKTAMVMDTFATKMEPEVGLLSTSLNNFMDTFSKVVSLVDQFDASFSQDPEFLESINKVSSILEESSQGIEQVKELLSAIPPIQKNLNKSKKSIWVQFSTMSKLMSTAMGTINEIKKMI
ncbi:hypothetical protein FQU75_22165 [Paenibacillus polymyxa]|nr:hypothetical protein FQU75_22165 [Paenibacillus polymyxa]